MPYTYILKVIICRIFSIPGFLSEAMCGHYYLSYHIYTQMFWRILEVFLLRYPNCIYSIFKACYIYSTFWSLENLGNALSVGSALKVFDISVRGQVLSYTVQVQSRTSKTSQWDQLPKLLCSLIFCSWMSPTWFFSLRGEQPVVLVQGSEGCLWALGLSFLRGFWGLNWTELSHLAASTLPAEPSCWSCGAFYRILCLRVVLCVQIEKLQLTQLLCYQSQRFV